MQKVVGSSPIIRSENPCKTAGTVAWKVNYPEPHGNVEVSIVASVHDGSQPMAPTDHHHELLAVRGGFSETCWKTARGGHVAAARVNSYWVTGCVPQSGFSSGIPGVCVTWERSLPSALAV